VAGTADAGLFVNLFAIKLVLLSHFTLDDYLSKMFLSAGANWC